MLVALLSHPLFILFTFFLVALTALALCAIRITRWFVIQRENRLWAFAFSNIFEATAFGMGGFLAAPHPTGDFRWMLVWARAAWGLFAFVFLGAVVLEYFAIKRTIRGRR